MTTHNQSCFNGVFVLGCASQRQKLQILLWFIWQLLIVLVHEGLLCVGLF